MESSKLHAVQRHLDQIMTVTLRERVLGPGLDLKLLEHQDLRQGLQNQVLSSSPAFSMIVFQRDLLCVQAILHTAQYTPESKIERHSGA